MKTYSTRQKAEFSQIFDALGHPRRIAVFIALQQAGADGLTFSALAKQANIADPSLAHHIRMMKKSGLVKGQIKGQFTLLSLNLSTTRQAIKQLGLS